MKIFFTSLLIIISFFLQINLIGQTDQQRNWLENFSQRITEEYRLKKLHADSLAKVMNIPIRREFEDGRIMELQWFENGLPVYFITDDNVVSARTMSTHLVWPGLGLFNLSGRGQLVGVWDGGAARVTHQEFGGRVIVRDGTTSVSQHATHVIGTVCASGVNPLARGMADSVRVDSYSWASDLPEITNAAINNLRVSNHSYGLSAGWVSNYFGDNRWAWLGDVTISEVEDYRYGFYSNESRDWDNMTYAAPNLLVTRSGGNERGDGPAPGTQHWVNIAGNWVLSTTARQRDGGEFGFDCTRGVTIAKNILAVGAIEDIPGSYVNPASVVMSSFSSWGPTDDGRIKPDVVANGVGLLSTDSPADNSYVSLSGTSMSAPSVSGSISLLLQHHNNLYGNLNITAATMKGIVIHTADEAGPNPGPDYMFGWGLMNTARSALLMDVNSQLGGNNLIRELTLNQGNVIQFQVQSSGVEPLKATISWTDPAGTPPRLMLNPPDIMLVNDLDIRIIAPNTTTEMPWILSPASPSSAATKGDNIRDNVEQVLIQNPVAGTYTVRITHKGNLFDGRQNLSLILSGTTMQLPAAVTLIAPANNAAQEITNPMLRWNKTPFAFSYHLQVARDSLFTNLFFERDGFLPTVIQLSNVDGNVKFFWRVRANNSGGRGAWSQVFNFMSLPTPNTPTLVSPLTNTVNVTIPTRFVWNRTPNAHTYRLQVANNAIFSSVFFNDSTLTDTTFTLATLLDGRNYFWRVWAKNTTGNSSFTGGRRLTTKLNSPDSVTVRVVPRAIQLNWADRSASETFTHILKRTGTGNFILYDSVLTDVRTFNDTNVVGGTSYSYRLYSSNSLAISDTTVERTIIFTSVKDISTTVPSEFKLSQNFPNPFNPVTVIHFEIPMVEAGNIDVSLTVYDVLGKEVAVLVNESKNPGVYEVTFDASRLPTGIYYYSLRAGDFIETRKMIFVK
ncbi:MAG: hypothetical protein C0425_01565, partial [Chlorobiaceae bacterium]|nr:hypothetical protein [Chlorobiaceae bacterium]MBA4309007.1 hypothetical protein [Chlorobiaceae bacterium]